MQELPILSDSGICAGQSRVVVEFGGQLVCTHAERHDRAGCPCKTIGEPTCSADVLMSDRESAPCRR